MVGVGNESLQRRDAAPDGAFQLEDDGIVGIEFGILFDLVKGVAEDFNEGENLGWHDSFLDAG